MRKRRSAAEAKAISANPPQEAEFVGLHVLAESVASYEDLLDDVDSSGDSLLGEEVGLIEGGGDALPAAEAISYALPTESVSAALSCSDWKVFIVSSADDILELDLKNARKPCKICYAMSLPKEEKDSIVSWCLFANVNAKN